MTTAALVCTIISTVIATVGATSAAFYFVLTLVIRNAMNEMKVFMSNEYVRKDTCHSIRRDCDRLRNGKR